jgi:RHS repeat-associated protein
VLSRWVSRPIVWGRLIVRDFILVAALRRRAPAGRRMRWAVAVPVALATVVAATQYVPALAGTAGRKPVPVAAAGRGPVKVAQSWRSLPNLGLPPGQRAAVEPPRLRVTPPSGDPAVGVPQARVAPRDGTTGPQATDLSLLPGLATGDTSLVVYFDAPTTGWTGGTVTLYKDSDHTNALHQGNFTFDEANAQQCRSRAIYCFTLANNADSWGLDTTTSYAVTVTLTATDGTTGPVSGFSPVATARTLPTPPSLPAAQVRGDLGTGSSGRLDARPAIRGVGVNTATGAFTQQAADAALSSSYVVNIQVIRSYNSNDNSVSLMGTGWSFAYDAKVFPKPGATDGSVVFRAEDGSETVYTRNADGTYASPPGVFSSLTARTGGGWLVKTPGGQQQLTFDALGKFLSVTDRRGKGVTIGYDAAGQPSTLTDAGGRVVTLTVSSGRLVTVKLPDGRQIFYSYSGSLLHTARDPDGDVTTYDYDSAGRLLKITDALGHVQLTNTYGTDGRVTAQTDALGHVTSFSWDSGKQESTVRDPDGVVVFDGYHDNVLQYTQIGNRTTIKRADANGSTQVLADPTGNQYESAHDANGNTTSTTSIGGSAKPTESADYDKNSNPKTVTDARGNTTSYTFNSFDQPTSVTDPLGNTTTFTYDANGLLMSTTDALGHTTSFSYDGAGDKTAQTDPDGNRTTYAFDASGRQVSVTDPRGNVSGADPTAFTTTTAYDGEDRVRKVTDPLGHFRTWDYDNAGRLHAYTDANGFQSVYEYDNANELTAAHDPDLRVTTYAYTPGGRTRSRTDGAGDVTSYTYDDGGRLRTMTAPRGNVAGANAADFTTTYTYDTNGNKTSESHPFPGSGTPAVTQYRYDATNHLVATTDPLGHTTTTTYDAAGNVVSATDAFAKASTATYDADNRLATTTDALGHTATRQYDAAGRLIAQITATGDRTTYQYDAAGRMTGQTTPRGNVAGADPAAFTTKYGYDPAGNQTSVTDPLGHTGTTVYDAVNNVLKQTDANGHSTTYTYDADARVITIRGPDATSATQVTTNGYDHAGNLISRTNPLGFVARFTYDAAQRPASSIDELGRIRQYSYDPDGNLTAVLTARATSSGDPATRAANTITQGYDILDRLTNRTLGSGASYSFGYDAAGRLTSLADATGQETRGYDDDGRLTGVTGPDGAYSYTYDLAGNLLTRTTPGAGTQTTTYDAANRPTTQSGPAGPTTYGYDADSELTTVTLPGGSQQARTYDGAGQVTSLTDKASNGSVQSAYTLTRDKVGNPVRLDTTQLGVSHSDAFTYDAADRITAMCYGTTTCSGATQKLSFTYDLVGNRLTRKRVGTGAFTQTYMYDAANELTATSGGPNGSVSYAYDPDGDQTTAGPTHTTYDLDGRVLSADDGTNRTTFVQNAAGNRVSADTTPDKGGATTHTGYQWDVNDSVPMLAAEQAGTGPVRAYTYQSDGRPLSLSVGTTRYLFQPDPFGNTADLTDLAGTVLQQNTMTDPFGGFTQATPGGTGTPDPRLLFQGEYRDPLSGNYHLRARDYTTDTGRFTSVDPLAQSGSTGATSPYAFGEDNPLANTDPSGMGCGWLSGLCNAASSTFHAVVNTATTVVDTVSNAVTTAVDDGVKFVDNTLSDLKQAATNVVHKAEQVTTNVVHTASNAVKATAHWVDQHKAEIAGIAAGIVAGAVCEAVTAGAGSIGCAALAGAIGNMVQYAVATPPGQWSVGGFLKTGAEGALSGAIGGVAGKFLGSAVAGLGGKLFGKAVGAAEEGAEGLEGAAAREGTEALEGGGSRAASDAADEEGALGDSAGVNCDSFDPSTRVLMADGTTKAIAAVHAGDAVTATAVSPAGTAFTAAGTGTSTAKPVAQLHDDADSDMADVTVAHGGHTEVVRTTQHHLFWSDDQKGWVPAGQLTTGTRLHSADGTAVVVLAVHDYTATRHMLDLTVPDDHTFYVAVGGTGVLVHNCPAGGPSQDPATTFNVPQKPGVYTIHLSSGDKYVGMSTTDINARVAASVKPGHALTAAGYCACDIVNVTWMELPRGVTSVTARRLEQTVMEGWKSLGVRLVNRRDPEFPLWFHSGPGWSGF